MSEVNLKIRYWLKFTLKLIVFAGTLYYLYIKVIDTEKFEDYLPKIYNLTSSSIVKFSLVIVLMFINWSIETFKWKYLITKLEFISFSKAYKAVWSGLTINNWIPNRTGEFIGRVAFVSRENRIKAISSTFVGNIAQLITMVSIGSMCFVLWLEDLQPLIELFLLVISGLITIVISYLYYNLNSLHKLFLKSRILRRYENYYNVLSSYNKNELTKILLLSAIRLTIYITQYYLLLIAFDIELSIVSGVIGICSIFFIQSVLPAITLTEIGIRGATVIFIFERFSNEFSGLLVSAYSLWIINVIIPTLFGAIFILFNKSQSKSSN